MLEWKSKSLLKQIVGWKWKQYPKSKLKIINNKLVWFKFKFCQKRCETDSVRTAQFNQNKYDAKTSNWVILNFETSVHYIYE